MSWHIPITRWLAHTQLGRALSAQRLRSAALARVRELVGSDFARIQEQTLLHLLAQACQLRVGLAHDFARIRTSADFRRLVPLQKLERSSHNTTQPSTSSLAASLWTSYAQAVQQVGLRRCRVGGTWLVLPKSVREAFLEFAHTQIKLPWRCAAWQECEPTELSRQSTSAFKHCQALVIEADTLAQQLGDFAELSPADALQSLCPNLQILVVQHSCHETFFAKPRVSSATVQVVELFMPGTGLSALRCSGEASWRLLPDVGVYYEFIPWQSAEAREPKRLGIHELELGQAYRLASTVGGEHWAKLTDLCIECVQPGQPIVKFLAKKSEQRQPSVVLMPSLANLQPISVEMQKR